MITRRGIFRGLLGALAMPLVPKGLIPVEDMAALVTGAPVDFDSLWTATMAAYQEPLAKVWLQERPTLRILMDREKP